jgi:hypothetical protein
MCDSRFRARAKFWYRIAAVGLKPSALVYEARLRGLFKPAKAGFVDQSPLLQSSGDRVLEEQGYGMIHRHAAQPTDEGVFLTLWTS